MISFSFKKTHPKVSFFISVSSREEIYFRYENFSLDHIRSKYFGKWWWILNPLLIRESYDLLGDTGRVPLHLRARGVGDRVGVSVPQYDRAHITYLFLQLSVRIAWSNISFGSFREEDDLSRWGSYLWIGNITYFSRFDHVQGVTGDLWVDWFHHLISQGGSIILALWFRFFWSLWRKIHLFYRYVATISSEKESRKFLDISLS